MTSSRPARDAAIPDEINVPISVDVAIAKFGAAYHARGKREALSTEPEIDDSEFQHRRLRAAIGRALTDATQKERDRCAKLVEARGWTEMPDEIRRSPVEGQTDAV